MISISTINWNVFLETYFQLVTTVFLDYIYNYIYNIIILSLSSKQTINKPINGGRKGGEVGFREKAKNNHLNRRTRYNFPYLSSTFECKTVKFGGNRLFTVVYYMKDITCFCVILNESVLILHELRSSECIINTYELNVTQKRVIFFLLYV